MLLLFGRISPKLHVARIHVGHGYRGTRIVLVGGWNGIRNLARHKVILNGVDAVSDLVVVSHELHSSASHLIHLHGVVDIHHPLHGQSWIQGRTRQMVGAVLQTQSSQQIR